MLKQHVLDCCGTFRRYDQTSRDSDTGTMTQQRYSRVVSSKESASMQSALPNSIPEDEKRAEDEQDTGIFRLAHDVQCADVP